MRDEVCAGMIRALAGDIRLAVVRQLLDGPRHVWELKATLGVDVSLLSHHLAVLRRAGLVVAVRHGRAVQYRLAGTAGSRGRERAVDFGCCRLVFE